MERRLHEASLNGDVEALNTLIQEDPLILDRLTVGCFNENPLHIAALRGHLDFTKAVVGLNPNLVTEVDSNGRSPLHLACDKGHVDIVRALLHSRSTSEVCLCRDKDGLIPLHLAVMKGRVEVIQELIQARLDSIMVRLKGGRTVLHLCVKYNALETLKWFLESRHADELINSKDDDGNTILHVAVALKNLEIIKYLLAKSAIKENANASNAKGFSALDVLEQKPAKDLLQDEEISGESKHKQIRDILSKAGARRTDQTNKIRQYVSTFRKRIEFDHNWLEQAHGNFLTAATLTATMAFQAGINPPGGFWQETKGNNKAGTAVLASIYSDKLFPRFFTYNTVSFGISLSVILLMISGLSLKNKLYMYAVSLAMSFTVLFMALSYLTSLKMIMPGNHKYRYYVVYTFVTCFWVFEVLFMLHSYRLSAWLLPRLQKIIGKRATGSLQGNV